MTDRLPSPSLLAFFTPSLFIIFIPHSAFPIFPIFLFLSHFSLLSLHYFIPSTLLSPSALPFLPSHLLPFLSPLPSPVSPLFPFHCFLLSLSTVSLPHHSRTVSLSLSTHAHFYLPLFPFLSLLPHPLYLFHPPPTFPSTFTTIIDLIISFNLSEILKYFSHSHL